MPRTTRGLNGLPIHRRGGYWICYVRDAAGKRYQRALHLRDDGSAASERAAVAAYWQEQARATSGAYARTGTPKPLGKAIAALQRAQEVAELSDSTHHKTLELGRNLLLFWGKDFDLRELVSTEQLVEYAADARTKRSGVTVQMELGILGQVMRAVGLDRPKAPKLNAKPKPQEPLSRVEQQLFLMAATKRHKLTMLLLLTLGPRASEVGKIGEIDWNERTMWIHGTKTAKSNRQVPIPDELFEEMDRLRRAGEWRGFPKVSRARIGFLVRSTCDRAGIPRRSPNDLRGTASRRMREAGYDAEIRGAVQGNSAFEQERTYTQSHTLIEAMRAAVNAPKPIAPGARKKGEGDADRDRNPIGRSRD